MNLNELLIKILKNATGFPVAQDEYEGKEEKYFIFSYLKESPAAYGDNKPIADTARLQIQMVTPKKFDYMAAKKNVRNALEDNGFSVYSINSMLGDVFQGTQKIRQTIFEAEYALSR